MTYFPDIEFPIQSALIFDGWFHVCFCFMVFKNISLLGAPDLQTQHTKSLFLLYQELCASQMPEWPHAPLPCPAMGVAFMVLHFICRTQHLSAVGRGHALRSLRRPREVLAQRSWVTRISAATLNFWASAATLDFWSFLFIKCSYIFWTD